ncbi:glycoside hydrolase family 19 protein [Paracoccus sulfuroxidans]|nr:glycoside hydrolase family 19 protein [Paracoccus sulfuroxidans]
MRIDRKKFFDALRASKFNAGRLNQMTVDVANGILDEVEKQKVTSVEHVSVIFGQCHHEAGGRLASIKETVFASHADQNPSDSTVAARLDSAFRRGVMTWVKTPYWRKDAAGKYWFGRGAIQLTHKYNYDRLGKEIGVDLVSDPAKALDPYNAGRIAAVGMIKGIFTGKRLADFRTRADMRRVVNGDYKDAKLQKSLAGYYDEYETIIKKAVIA